MNVFCKMAVAAFVVATIAPVAEAADKDAIVTINGPVTPGIYGRVAMASTATAAATTVKPPLVYSQAMLVDAPSATGAVEPVYLHVPPDHAKNWKKYCAKYDACNKPVFFIKSAEYEPGYQPPKPEPQAGKAKRKFRNGF